MPNVRIPSDTLRADWLTTDATDLLEHATLGHRALRLHHGGYTFASSHVQTLLDEQIRLEGIAAAGSPLAIEEDATHPDSDTGRTQGGVPTSRSRAVGAMQGDENVMGPDAAEWEGE